MRDPLCVCVWGGGGQSGYFKMLCVCIVALHPWLTAMVMSELLVNFTILFVGRLRPPNRV